MLLFSEPQAELYPKTRRKRTKCARTFLPAGRLKKTKRTVFHIRGGGGGSACALWADSDRQNKKSLEPFSEEAHSMAYSEHHKKELEREGLSPESQLSLSWLRSLARNYSACPWTPAQRQREGCPIPRLLNPLLPRVINFKFPLQPHLEYITSHNMKNLAFRNLLRSDDR